MKRYFGLALALAAMVPLTATGADAAKKSKKQPTRVFGFVQTASGTLSNPNRFGERRINGYRDNTQQFFAHIANRGPG